METQSEFVENFFAFLWEYFMLGIIQILNEFVIRYLLSFILINLLYFIFTSKTLSR